MKSYSAYLPRVYARKKGKMSRKVNTLLLFLSFLTTHLPFSSSFLLFLFSDGRVGKEEGGLEREGWRGVGGRWEGGERRVGKTNP